ncbi:hydroxyisourate hydrolase [Peribacillus sp. SCS-155]|uniref:hydroxyisourate hydrolase n=1 Tax=Peribacillus sedimenti TaxID=3115297 RepID=UPI003905A787
MITTHILDLSKGKPAKGVLVELWRETSENHYEFMNDSHTNEDGRIPSPLVQGEAMKKGIYELRFYVAEYYRSEGALLEDNAFLDCVPVRFRISGPGSHYHIPLLLSPGGYSTYRGS